MKKFLVTAFAVAFLAAWVVPSVAGVDFSGQYRVRGEYKSPTNFMDNGGESNSFVGQRVRLTGVAKPTSDVTVKVTIQDSRNWGANMKTAKETGSIGAGPQLTDKDGTAIVQGNHLDLHESYVLINDFFGLPVDLKVGRQELVYGDQRLLGSFGWDNNGSSFDAAKLSTTIAQTAIDFFWAKNRESDSGFEGTDEDQDFYGLYTTTDLASQFGLSRADLDIYALFLRDGQANTGIVGSLEVPEPTGLPSVISGSQQLWTIGARAAINTPFVDMWDVTAELPYQFGEISWNGNPACETESGIVPCKSQKIAAMAFALNVGVTPVPDLRFGFEYDYATGDETDHGAAIPTSDGDINTFSVLSPTQHGHYGMMDQVGWRNMSAWSLNVKKKNAFSIAGRTVHVRAAYWNFEKAEGEDFRYSAANWMGQGRRASS